MHKIKLIVIEPKAAIHSLFPAGDAALESSYIPTRASDHNMLPNGQLTREAKRYDMVNQSNKVLIKPTATDPHNFHTAAKPTVQPWRCLMFIV